MLIISDILIFFISANFFIVYLIKLGSFFFPLIGIGARKGLSVSTNNLLLGIFVNVFCKSELLLKVIIPLAEKYEFNFSIFLDNT